MKALMKPSIKRDHMSMFHFLTSTSSDDLTHAYAEGMGSSADFPVIPLETARAMSPRPPSPTTAAATQRAVRRENPNQLFTRSATTLTKMQSMSSFHGQKSKTSSPSRARTINSGGLTTKNVLPLSPKSPNAKAKAPVRPPRDARRKDPQPEVRR